MSVPGRYPCTHQRCIFGLKNDKEMSHTISPFFEIFIISLVIAVSHIAIFFNSMLKYLAFCWNADTEGYEQKY